MTVVEKDLLNIDVSGICSQIPSLKDIVYFNSGWTGPMPASSIKAIQKSIEYQQTVGPSSKDGVKTQIREILDAKNKIADFFQVDSKSICLTTNTTLGINLALNAYDWKESDEIIATTHDHASMLIPIFNLKERFGVKVKLVEFDQIDPVSSFKKAISKNTKALAFCHLFWTNGALLPLKEIVSLCKSNNIISIVDGAQSGGVVDFNLKESDVDFYAVPGQKWLLGPVGSGFLYINDKLHGKRPPWPSIVGYESAGDAGDDSCYSLDCTWKAKKHAGVFEFGGLNNSLFCGLSSSLEFTKNNMKQFDIYSRIKTLSAYFIEELKNISNITVETKRDFAGLVAWGHKKVSAYEMVKKLWEEKRILIREIENFNYCRASIHYFNTKDEIDFLIKSLKAF